MTRFAIWAGVPLVLFALQLGTPLRGQQTPAPAPQPLKSVSLGLVPYPAKKQSTTQQTKDDTECYDWTRQSTGIDLSAPVSQQASTAQPAASGAGAHGALRGAAAGAAVGGIADDKAAEGAAIGAVAGAAHSSRKKKEQAAQAQQQASEAQQAQAADRLNTFRKGYTACMEARGYTIK